MLIENQNSRRILISLIIRSNHLRQEKPKRNETNLEFFQTDFSKDLLSKVIDHLYQKQLQSILIEGGEKLLQSFIDQQLWDEARIFIAPNFLSAGIQAPQISGEKIAEENISGDRLLIFKPHA